MPQCLNDASAEYAALCDKVEKLDPAAARYMRDPATQLKEDFSYKGDLMACFIWGETPQGHAYWSQLQDRVRNEKETNHG